jgi:hypothetical protein
VGFCRCHARTGRRGAAEQAKQREAVAKIVPGRRREIRQSQPSKKKVEILKLLLFDLVSLHVFILLTVRDLAYTYETKINKFLTNALHRSGEDFPLAKEGWRSNLRHRLAGQERKNGEILINLFN